MHEDVSRKLLSTPMSWSQSSSCLRIAQVVISTQATRSQSWVYSVDEGQRMDFDRWHGTGPSRIWDTVITLLWLQAIQGAKSWGARNSKALLHLPFSSTKRKLVVFCFLLHTSDHNVKFHLHQGSSSKQNLKTISPACVTMQDCTD